MQGRNAEDLVAVPYEVFHGHGKNAVIVVLLEEAYESERQYLWLNWT